MRDHRLKYARAKVHHDALKAAMREDGQRLFHDLRLEDGEDGEIVVHAHFGEPPPEWGLIAGDAIHNYRSSLDALLLGLVDAAGATLSDAERKRIQFPVFETEDRFTEWERRYGAHLPAGALFTLRAVQPFAPCTYLHGPPLRALHDLDNVDKHRRLLLVRSFVAQGKLNVFRLDHSPVLEGIPLATGLIKPGDEVARFRLPDGLTRATVTINYNVGRSVVFADNLKDASLSVEGQLTTFWHFLEYQIFRPLEPLLQGR